MYCASPEVLGRLGVSATYSLQNTRDLVVTGPGVVHGIQHYTWTKAVAINIVPKNIWDLPELNPCNYPTMPRMPLNETVPQASAEGRDGTSSPQSKAPPSEQVAIPEA
ncbi:hypothetical protein QAD02_005477 [Eretmocerus hayati]|uniref:Uncharacterized protein n=1 Tax=Eretmocerus hayati TaxID=131215 RepID=A0ACC2NSF2_9HYME|nr:hypothetical protein QAD02_005477 [Eretmocerus hayati]